MIASLAGNNALVSGTSGDPTPSTFSKVLRAQWEEHCRTNGRHTAVQMGGVLLGFSVFKAKKPGSYSDANGGRTTVQIAVLSSRPVGGFRNSSDCLASQGHALTTKWYCDAIVSWSEVDCLGGPCKLVRACMLTRCSSKVGRWKSRTKIREKLKGNN